MDMLQLDLKVPRNHWALLSREDQAAYMQLHLHFIKQQKEHMKDRRNNTFFNDIQCLLKYIEYSPVRKDDRAICIGLACSGPFVCVNTQQIKIILGRCKSSINNSFQQIGYEAIKTKGKSREAVLAIIPSLSAEQNTLRKWTVRCASEASSACFVSRFHMVALPLIDDEDLYDEKKSVQSTMIMFRQPRNEQPAPGFFQQPLIQNSNQNNMNAFQQMNFGAPPPPFQQNMSNCMNCMPNNMNMQNNMGMPNCMNMPNNMNMQPMGMNMQQMQNMNGMGNMGMNMNGMNGMGMNNMSNMGMQQQMQNMNGMSGMGLNNMNNMGMQQQMQNMNMGMNSMNMQQMQNMQQMNQMTGMGNMGMNSHNRHNFHRHNHNHTQAPIQMPPMQFGRSPLQKRNSSHDSNQTSNTSQKSNTSNNSLSTPPSATTGAPPKNETQSTYTKIDDGGFNMPLFSDHDDDISNSFDFDLPQSFSLDYLAEYNFDDVEKDTSPLDPSSALPRSQSASFTFNLSDIPF
ncbi:hypothetical protein TRFO_39489 [Tritrichomonas foetus]|uniref:Initiator binding domain-containing protein n=1 Tax=Tritrichomonas foetus TaxID=1144522 RepID=A0A1J4JAL3_9EUKA|nr:hypothetical protein TRFO_39489 [Tritrichomonas foetus]|eukprot:OHS94300.1 hypothetical protein TRFO_39489 [Tritrichomonas foetus]